MKKYSPLVILALLALLVNAAHAGYSWTTPATFDVGFALPSAIPIPCD